MIEFNKADCRIAPFQHQVHGTVACLRHSAFALFDEMGTCKSKQVIDAACALYKAHAVEIVLVICPASVKPVWRKIDKKDVDLDGEIHKHGWASVQHRVIEYKLKGKKHWQEIWKDGGDRHLVWLVTNYEFIREKGKLAKLLRAISGRKVMLVMDESSYIKNHKSKQAKAVFKIRDKCIRRYALNGTPVVENPLDLWAQFEALDPKIFGSRFENFWAFRWHFSIMKKITLKSKEEKEGEEPSSRSILKPVAFQNIHELQEITRPYCLRREKKDCLDLPEKLYVIREVPLSEETWEIYKQMRDQAIAFLPNDEVAVEPNAAVRLLRLEQLTSGLLGSRTEPVNGVGEDIIESFEKLPVKDISNEKIDWCTKYLEEELAGRSVIVWSRWVRERERLVESLTGAGAEVFALYGGQTQRERDAAINAFMGPADKRRRILVAQQQAGGHGLTLVKAHEILYLSNSRSLALRLQSEDRSHRPGQRHNVTYVDALATGPEGQKTMDHITRKALLKKENIAKFTAARWRRELTDF